jgi:hypothetical protein
MPLGALEDSGSAAFTNVDELDTSARTWFSKIKGPFRGIFNNQNYHIRASELLMSAALFAGESFLIKAKYHKLARGHRFTDKCDSPLATFIFKGRTVYAEASSPANLGVHELCPILKFFNPGRSQLVPIQALFDIPALNLYFCAELSMMYCKEYQTQILLQKGDPRLVVPLAHQHDPFIMAPVIRSLANIDGKKVPSIFKVESSKSRRVPELYTFLIDLGTQKCGVSGAVLNSKKFYKLIGAEIKRETAFSS